MRNRHFAVMVAGLVALVAGGCGKEEGSSGDQSKATVKATKKVAEEKVAPYAYPAPVKGHIKEINIGEFDLVDGIAYPAMGGGTVVYVVSKPIASPMLVELGLSADAGACAGRSCATRVSAR